MFDPNFAGLVGQARGCRDSLLYQKHRPASALYKYAVAGSPGPGRRLLFHLPARLSSETRLAPSSEATFAVLYAARGASVLAKRSRLRGHCPDGRADTRLGRLLARRPGFSPSELLQRLPTSPGEMEIPPYHGLWRRELATLGSTSND